MFFNKKIKTTLTEFLTELKSGNENVLKIIGLNESNFNTESYEQILENPSDIASGVIRVKTKFNIKAFGIFNNILLKEYDNGDLKHIFYVTTRDYEKINSVAETIYSTLGTGYFDAELPTSFKDKEKLSNLTKGISESIDDEIMNLWIIENITVLLQYKSQPMFEFSLFVTKTIEKDIDRTSRQNGNITELLKTDFSILFIEQEESKTENIENDGTISYVRYYYELNPTEFNVFNQLEIQQGGNKKDHSFQNGTNLTFTSSKDISLVNMIEVTEKLIKIYGPDNGGTEELEIHELDILENRQSWTGRSWGFNEVHGIYNVDNPNEKPSYSVWLSYDEYGFGFTLSIIGYNHLREYFVSE
ncbi:hypothetical protein [uncultured Dokdonia sp.]|uniref:hypothetical protein n=1 Tax=uncultured Dokdonia sp. TaxID=575653 RepID=UPI0026176CE7|nr:hypothetical protein [uncultured Dokdonia sp.]